MDKYEKAQLLINDEAQERVTSEKLERYFDLIESEVLNYCHRLDFPTGLMLLVIQMVAEYANASYNLEKMADKDIEDPLEGREVSSITRGDTTISYGSSRFERALTPAGKTSGGLSVKEFVNDYSRQLYGYRKVRTV